MALTLKQQAALAGWRDQLGRWQAARLGLYINKGGWLYSHVNRKPVAQGYRSLYHRHYRLIWAALSQEAK